MNKTVVRAASILNTLSPLGACATVELEAPLEAPDAPVDALRLLSDLASIDGDATCAAESVEAERVSRAVVEGAGGATSRPMPTLYRSTVRTATKLNLSQASELMAGSIATARAQTAAAKTGVPGAGLRSARARRDFEQYASVVERSGRDRRSSGDRTSDVRSLWIAAQYAAVWSGYYAMPDSDAERGPTLDWLTTRSMENPQMLRAYHWDLTEALTGPSCS